MSPEMMRVERTPILRLMHKERCRSAFLSRRSTGGMTAGNLSAHGAVVTSRGTAPPHPAATSPSRWGQNLGGGQSGATSGDHNHSWDRDHVTPHEISRLGVGADLGRVAQSYVGD